MNISQSSSLLGIILLLGRWSIGRRVSGRCSVGRWSVGLIKPIGERNLLTFSMYVVV